ncbi:MAG: YifB family Mg chelatase-like AAA ATPase [Pseudomonadota bacterium]|jgi:magnesium chelatase family protein|nr:YifB family Mg chelatase-like AAA ATPase [Alphaproteobacteria bacterium]
MKFATSYTVAFLGVQPKLIEVQVQFAPGLPAFTIVGLADKAVAESRERIRACLHGLGMDIPAVKLTVNLTPADLQKEGSHYDLPIALAILAVMNIIPKDEVKDYISLGEITLDNRILRVPGVLPAALLAGECYKGIICPKDCGAEASWAGEVRVLAPRSVLELIKHFKNEIILSQPEPKLEKEDINILDMQEVKAQRYAKRGLEIAAAGGHNVLMIGPPGAGKSMLAARMPGILPKLTPKEALEVTVVHSLSGITPSDGLVKTRPFRAPHHSASLPALVGGGQKSKPGEISLAHNGVLFLDEFPEFSRACLESLRQPLETGSVTIARVQHHYTYPARFQCIAAMNPCRCGYFGDANRQCNKIPRCAEEYQQKISGPIIDRFDLIIPVQALKPEELQTKNTEESSHNILQRVEKARAKQYERYGSHVVNAYIDNRTLDKTVSLETSAETIFRQAIERYNLSARGYHRLLRVARTIADLDDSHPITSQHVLEALNYRLNAFKR